jgi:Fe-S oxidoreductase/nitrate reductase gamma subunit
MRPTREIYWNIDNHYLLYALFAVSVLLFAWGSYRRLQVWRVGLEDHRLDAVYERLAGTVKQVLSHARIIRYPLAGLFHALLFGGFVVLFMGTVVVLLDADFGLPVMQGHFYLYFQSLVLDMAGLAALAGILLAIVHRYVLRPGRYEGTSGDPLLLAGLAAILASGFLIEGARISVTRDPWGSWSLVGLWVSRFFADTSVETQATTHRVLWWFHLTAVLGLFAYLPHSRFIHALIGPVNIFLRNRNRGALKPARYGVEHFEDLETCGVGEFEEFTWKHIFDFSVCTECGRCTDNCPAHAAGRPLSPRDLTLALRDYGYAKRGPGEKGATEDPAAMVGDVIDPETLWSCTTCGACEQECPAFIEYIDKIVDMRRHLVENSQNPSGFNAVFQNVKATGNPFGKPPEKRVEWLQDMGGLPVRVLEEGESVDVLFYVDGYGAYDPKSRAGTRAVATGLHRTGIDFGILGEREMDTGHQVRRMGEEGLFQFLVKRNMETLGSVRFNRIVTVDPHAFNTLKHDYPGTFCISHYTHYFAELLAAGKLRPRTTPIGGSICTYHDPCYLGRHNATYEPPRQLLRAIPGMKLVEMDRNRDRSFCCGGGDVILWHEMEKEEIRPATLRVRMARAAGADVLVTACPFCFIHFDDAVKTEGLEEEIKVVDLMTLFVDSL